MCQIFSYAWCISRILAGVLSKTEHMFVHILHLLWETLFLQMAVWVVFGTHSISQENTGKNNGGGIKGY